MSTKQNTALTGLIIALVFASGCRRIQYGPGPGMGHGREANRTFRIYIYADPSQAGQCLVDWPQAALWKTQKQTATWVSDDGAAYTVDFGNNSPFSQGTFYVPANSEKPSGDLINGPGYYAYRIEDANNNTCKPSSDPGIYVK